MNICGHVRTWGSWAGIADDVCQALPLKSFNVGQLNGRSPDTWEKADFFGHVDYFEDVDHLFFKNRLDPSMHGRRREMEMAQTEEELLGGMKAPLTLFIGLAMLPMDDIEEGGKG